MSLLSRNYQIATRYGGGFVQSIDGLAGGQEATRPIDWFYYVNGVQAAKGAAATNVSRGDHIWWDRHDWSQTDDVPAVVGSFPEPFLNGLEGKRYPMRVECAQIAGAACATVSGELRTLAIPAAAAGLGAGSEPKSLRVIVGSWSQIGYAARRAEPRTRSARKRRLRDASRATGARSRRSTRTAARLAALAAGTGLIAATRQAEDAPIWVVTGTDATGVALAAKSFNERRAARSLRARDHRRWQRRAAGAITMSRIAPRRSLAYRRRASPLHAARASIAAAYGAAIATRGADLRAPAGCSLRCSARCSRPPRRPEWGAS